MDARNHKEIAEFLRDPEDMLHVLEDFLNMGGDTSMRLYLDPDSRQHKEESRWLSDKPIADWHPTLQQCLMRGFIVPAIKALSTDTMPDARNQGTVKMCKEMLPITEKYQLPFV
jgi:hypothetical protein